MKPAVSAALLVTLAACQPTVEGQPLAAVTEPATGNVARGLDVADRNCSLCHAIGGEGASPHPRAPAFRILSPRYPFDSLRKALAEGSIVGHTGMPQVQLEPQKVRDLIAYLETIQVQPVTRPK